MYWNSSRCSIPTKEHLIDNWFWCYGSHYLRPWNCAYVIGDERVSVAHTWSRAADRFDNTLPVASLNIIPGTRYQEWSLAPTWFVLFDSTELGRVYIDWVRNSAIQVIHVPIYINGLPIVTSVRLLAEVVASNHPHVSPDEQRLVRGSSCGLRARGHWHTRPLAAGQRNTAVNTWKSAERTERYVRYTHTLCCKIS